jgi:hypothetical protein
MSALEALHDEYFDGIPVDSGSPNYAKGLKALAKYIDNVVDKVHELDDRLDDQDLAAQLSDIDLMQDRIGELLDRVGGLEDLWEDREGRTIGPYSLTHAKDCIEDAREALNRSKDNERFDTVAGNLEMAIELVLETLNDLVESDADLSRQVGDVDEDLANLRNRDESLADRIDGIQKGLAQLRHKVNNRDYQSLKAKVDRDYDGTATAIRELESRLDDLEHTVDDVGATADRADQKADDTDRLVGEILETLDEEGLLYVPTGEVAEQAGPAKKLSHLQVSELLRSTHPNASILGSTSAGHPNHSFHGTCAKINGQRYRISPRLHVEESGDGFLRGTDQAKEVQRELRAAYFKGEWEKGGDVYKSLDELAKATDHEYFLEVKANGSTWAQLRRSLDDDQILVAEFKAMDAKRRFKSLLQQRDVTFSTMYHVAGLDGVAFHQDDLAPDRARTLLLSCLSEHIAVTQ